MLMAYVQVAALELKGHRMQLEQQDVVDQHTSPEALQRLQQQVHYLPTCTQTHPKPRHGLCMPVNACQQPRQAIRISPCIVQRTTSNGKQKHKCECV